MQSMALTLRDVKQKVTRRGKRDNLLWCYMFELTLVYGRRMTNLKSVSFLSSCATMSILHRPGFRRKNKKISNSIWGPFTQTGEAEQRAQQSCLGQAVKNWLELITVPKLFPSHYNDAFRSEKSELGFTLFSTSSSKVRLEQGCFCVLPLLATR